MKLLGIFSHKILQVIKNLMPISKNQPVRTISQCAQCGEEFNGLIALKDHIKKVHLPERMIKFGKPAGKVETKNETEVETKVEEKKEDKPIDEKPQPIVSSPQAVIPDPDPIVLEYHYKGQCFDCRHEVRTIILEAGEDSYATAYCSNCDKKLLQTKVIPISSQFKK